MRKALSDVINDLYGTQVAPNVNPLVSSLTTTAARIASNNNNRFQLLIVNLGTDNIFIGLGSDVSASKGIQVNANGGTLVFKFRDDLNLVGFEFWGVANSGTQNILVIETLSY